MPEGPEVHSQADALNAFLQNSTITRIRFRKGWTNRKTLDPGFDDLISSLPLKVVKVWAAGKKIIIRFRGYRYIVVFLGMEGRWSYEKLKYSHIYIQTQENNRIWYDDKRYLGNFEVCNSRESLRLRLSKIGPDLITDLISTQDWLDETTNSKVATKQICDFLMDQKYFSGIGNYLKAEILYAAKIRPDACMGELSRSLLETLFEITRKIIYNSYVAQGASLYSYINTDGKKGNFQCIVYGNATDPLDNPVIKSIFQDDRVTHWVPAIQVLPSPWNGYSRLSHRKLKTTNKSDGYLNWELRSFCLQRHVGTEGTKAVMIRRLLTTI